MDFRPHPDGESTRVEARALFSELVTEEVRTRVRTSGTLHDATLHRALCERGWLTASWPPDDGGQGRSAVEMVPFFEEAYFADAPLVAALTTMLVAETLRRIGTEHQRRTVLEPIVRGDLLVCLGLSEPDAGSDVAAARTRAVRDGDEWVIDGQKMFTTMAHDADYVYLLARTNPDVAKHRGLTMFLFPMSTPGIEVQRVSTLGGERTNITYYSDVRVPDAARVGGVDDGWSTLAITLAFERGMVPTAGIQCQHLMNQLEQWAQESTGMGGRRPIEDSAVRQRLARLRARTEAARLLGYRSVWTHDQERMPVTEGSMAKLFASELLREIARAAVELVGPESLASIDDRDPVSDGAFEHAYRHSPVEAIYGGTSEIQRTILATQHLGLPRI